MLLKCNLMLVKVKGENFTASNSLWCEPSFTTSKKVSMKVRIEYYLNAGILDVKIYFGVR